MNATRKWFQWLFLGVGVALIGDPTPGFARMVTVGVGLNNSTSFTPAVTNIAAGDSVNWVWNYTSTFISHNSTSTNSAFLWSSGTHTSPFSFTNTFPTAGSFPYQCTIHVGFGMTGEIVVAVASLPPTVTITNPANNVVFGAPATFNLAAAASGDVTNVQFFEGAVSLGSVAASPFSMSVNGLGAGTNTFAAVATSTNTLTATNSITVNVVNPVAIRLSAPGWSSPGHLQFSYSANAGLNYVVLRSTNLLAANWTALATNAAGAGSVTFTDANATIPQAFYRVGRLPNP